MYCLKRQRCLASSVEKVVVVSLIRRVNLSNGCTQRSYFTICEAGVALGGTLAKETPLDSLETAWDNRACLRTVYKYFALQR